MYNKIFLTIIMCLVLTATRAQTTISVGCTMPPCFPCLASFTGSWSSSDNTIAGVDPSTGYITGVGGGTAIITFTYNVASCGTGVFTSTVNVIPSFIVTGVDETAPILIPGERDYTYCASGGLTLNVNTIPAVLPGATYTWDDGVTIATTLSSPVYSPTYTPTGSTVVHTYTVTVVQGSTVSCSATAIVRVVVPATGCSPCDYFNVNAYRTLDGLATIPLGTCPDCSTLQPFHTITAPALDMTNTVDNANYYVVHNASLDKPNYNRDNFFMNGGVSLSVSAISNVTIAGSHLFSALQCQWNGINVAVTSSSAGSLNIVNDCLIENAGNGGTAGVNINGTGSTSFFMPGMHQILFSYGSVYNSNGGDINIQNYSPP